MTTSNIQLLPPPHRLFLSSYAFQFNRTGGLLYHVSQNFGLCHWGRDITPCFSAYEINCLIQRFQKHQNNLTTPPPHHPKTHSPSEKRLLHGFVNFWIHITNIGHILHQDRSKAPNKRPIKNSCHNPFWGQKDFINQVTCPSKLPTTSAGKVHKQVSEGHTHHICLNLD